MRKLKYLLIKQELTKFISSFSANQRIPSRKFICRKWNISRRTADKIISELQREGVVYCIKGSGTYVSLQQSRETTGGWNRKRHWAVIIPDISSGIYTKVFAGIEEFALSHNIDFVICQTFDDVTTEFALVQREIASDIDGLIIVPAITTTENFRNYNYIVRSGIPFVFWQRSVDYMLNIPQFLLNGYYGGYIATKHLLDQGYRKISYLAPSRFRSSMDRYMGYCAALSEAGIDINPCWVRIGIPQDSKYHCAAKLLQQADPPDAFVCFVDSLAAVVVQAIWDMNLRVSDDVGVIGFEGVATWLDQDLNLGLTYVDINCYESGRSAAESLWALMTQEHPKIETRIFAPKLIIRNTCCGKKPCIPTIPEKEGVHHE